MQACDPSMGKRVVFQGHLLLHSDVWDQLELHKTLLKKKKYKIVLVSIENLELIFKKTNHMFNSTVKIACLSITTSAPHNKCGDPCLQFLHQKVDMGGLEVQSHPQSHNQLKISLG